MKTAILRWGVPCALLLLIGCRGPVPIYNVSAAPVTTNKPATLDEVQKAIIRGGVSIGWQIVPRKPGILDGVTSWATHRAVVEIKFDTKTYSINYKDSDNLKYDGSNIHPFYNQKVQDLDKSIRTQLNLLGM
jgi:hypothetical protein